MAQVILDAAVRLVFPPAPLFVDHFPGAPRVPGSCIVEAARRSLEASLPSWSVHELLGARFRHFVRPEEELLLQLRVSAASPDAAPFAPVGAQVKAGQTLCILEAMKMMSEVPSPVSGVITEVLVSDGELVGFDQPLFRVKEC